MSLNWKEIDLVLSELDIAGAKIERIIQPSYDALSFGLYKAGKTMELFISIAQGACRIHLLSSSPPKPERPLRFMECLRSRVRGGRIEALRQLGSERIVRMDISVLRSVEDSDSPIEAHSYRLYVRLWSGAGNIVLVDQEGIVVDALARRPRRGETWGRSAPSKSRCRNYRRGKIRPGARHAPSRCGIFRARAASIGGWKNTTRRRAALCRAND